MLSVESVAAWAVTDIKQNINALLSEGQTCEVSQHEEFHVVRILHGEDTIWQDQSADLRLVLLSAFGWLWSRGKTTQHPAWRPRNLRSSPRPVYVVQSRIPDPPDLDPKELEELFQPQNLKKR